MLSIAGTDPSGGAGTAADMKSITAAGGYGMTVITSLVAQNTRGVRDIHIPPTSFLEAQLCAVSDDVKIDAVKTGMLATSGIIATVSSWLDTNPPIVLVVDPVMVATSGDRLLDPDAEHAMAGFCRRATVVTPNIHELARLVGRPPATDETEALDQATRWAAGAGVSVVVKTGHLDSPLVTNTWVWPDGTRITVPSRRLHTTSTHGTGCSLASALATRLGRGDTPQAALAWATEWLHEAIAHGAALDVGFGHGPIDHSYRSRRLQAAASASPWLGTDTVPTVLRAPADLRPVPDRAIHPSTQEIWVQPAVDPAGPWTAALWAAGAPTTSAIADSSFVGALVDGTLPEPAFGFYLAQDALYLTQYARALAALARTSTDPEDQAFWERAAATCITIEAELHRTWLRTPPARRKVAISPVTSAYTDFLLASTLADDRAVGCAAVLPCYWLYAQTGATLPTVPADHPYAAWLATYRDPVFVTATREALRRVEHAFEAATPAVRAAAARAYLTACRHELEFFDQALRVEGGAERSQAEEAGL